MCSGPHLNNPLPQTSTQHINSLFLLQTTDRRTYQCANVSRKGAKNAKKTAERLAWLVLLSTFSFQLSRAYGMCSGPHINKHMPHTINQAPIISREPFKQWTAEHTIAWQYRSTFSYVATSASRRRWKNLRPSGWFGKE